jgi:hypothetical protein
VILEIDGSRFGARFEWCRGGVAIARELNIVVDDDTIVLDGDAGVGDEFASGDALAA